VLRLEGGLVYVLAAQTPTLRELGEHQVNSDSICSPRLHRRNSENVSSQTAAELPVSVTFSSTAKVALRWTGRVLSAPLLYLVNSLSQPANHRRILAACCGAHVIQDGLIALQFVLLPLLATQFGLNYSQVGLLRGISNTAMTVLEIPAGLLAERFGERRLLAFGLVMAGAGYIGVALSPGFAAIALFFLLTGVGAAFQHSLASAAVVNTFDGPSRRHALGTYNSSGDAGKLAYTGIFSLCLGAGLAWNVVVVVLSVAAVVFAAVLWIWLIPYETQALAPSVRDASGKSGRWGIADRLGFSLLGIVVFLDSLVQAVFLTFLAFVFLDKGVNGGVAAFSVVLALTGGMIGKYLGGYLAARTGDRNAFVLIQLFTIVGFLLMILLPATPLLVVLPLIGMVVQGSSTVSYGAIANFTDAERQARGFALIYSVGSAAAASGPFLFGMLADAVGLSIGLATLAVITAITLPFSFVLARASAD